MACSQPVLVGSHSYELEGFVKFYGLHTDGIQAPYPMLMAFRLEKDMNSSQKCYLHTGASLVRQSRGTDPLTPPIVTCEILINPMKKY